MNRYLQGEKTVFIILQSDGRDDDDDDDGDDDADDVRG